jgi:hypothetical protein
LEGVLRYSDERLLGRLPVTGVDADDRDLGRQRQCVCDLVQGIPLYAVEVVDGDDERQPLGLEVVQRRER